MPGFLKSTLNFHVCAQSCLTLCGSMDYSPPDSSVHGILQTRIVEHVSFPFPGDLPDPEMEPESLVSPALVGRFFTVSDNWEALSSYRGTTNIC